MLGLRVLVGPSPASLEDISSKVNRGISHNIVSDVFEGRVCIYIKGFTDHINHSPGIEFFDREDRRGVTWSIQVQGRFLQRHSANDILFGNVFDGPLHLPWGSGAALQLIKYIDPTLDHNLTSHCKPWALSPLISTMPYLSHSHISNIKGLSDFPHFPQLTSITEDVSQLSQAVSSTAVASNRDPTSQLMKLQMPSHRRAYFNSEPARSQITFGPEDVLTTDFCYGFIKFDGGLALKLPGGLSFNLEKYWDGQPVRFVCCERSGGDNSQDPWGRIFWCVSIERE